MVRRADEDFANSVNNFTASRKVGSHTIFTVSHTETQYAWAVFVRMSLGKLPPPLTRAHLKGRCDPYLIGAPKSATIPTERVQPHPTARRCGVVARRRV